MANLKSNRKMKVGVIGLGWMGKVHLRVYSELPGVEVVGAVDVDNAVLDDVRDRFDIPVYQDMDEFLGMDIDAVSVCVPTSRHLPIGLEVIERGIPLLIEKPLAVSVDEGKKLIAAAAEKNIPLMVGHIERFNPAVARIKELLEDDAPISIQIVRVGPYPPRIKDVGVIKDLGSHDIDLIRYITGSRYKKLYAVVSGTLGKHEDTALITAQMENGVLGQITTNWVTPYKSRQIHVATKTRYIEANLITQQVKEYSNFVRYDQSYSVREWPIVYREPVRQELKQFLTSVREGASVPISGEDGLYVLETIERLEQIIS